MGEHLPTMPGAVFPTAEDTLIALDSSRRLAGLSAEGRENLPQFHLQSAGLAEPPVALPAVAVRLLKEILAELAKGNAVAVMPVDAELTTQEAADLLRVSRPFLVEQLEQGVIPHRKVGTHRRVRAQDVIEYKHTLDQNRLKVLDELAAQAQELDMGY